VGDDSIWVSRRISHDWLMFLVNFRGDEQMIAIKMHKRRVKVNMSVIAELILDLVIQNKNGISVMNLIELTMAVGVGSPATNHRSMLWLKTNKYIKVVFKDGNLRTKYLVPTKKGLSHFKGLE
jgi:hypothetical protein